MEQKYYTLAALTILFSSSAVAQATYDFNTPGQLSNNFTIVDDTFNHWSQATDGGINNTGRVQLLTPSSNNQDSSGLITNQKFDDTSNFSMTTLFEHRDASAGYSFMMGVVPSTTSTFDVGSTTGVVQLGVGLRVSSSSTATDSVVSLASYNNDTASTIGSTSTTLDFGSWYELDLDFSRSGSTWTIGMALQEVDVNTGNTIGSVLNNFVPSITLTNSAISTGGDLHGILALSNAPNFRNIESLDNVTFSAIPEPSSAALWGGLAVLIAMVSSRRISLKR